MGRFGGPRRNCGPRTRRLMTPSWPRSNKMLTASSSARLLRSDGLAERKRLLELDGPS